MKTSHKRNVHTPSSSKLVIISILKGEMFLPYPFNNEIVFFVLLLREREPEDHVEYFDPITHYMPLPFAQKKSSLPFFARFSGVFSVETPQVPLNKFFPIVIKNEKSFSSSSSLVETCNMSTSSKLSCNLSFGWTQSSFMFCNGKFMCNGNEFSYTMTWKLVKVFI